MTSPPASVRRLSPRIWVAGQMWPEDIADLQAAGFTILVNHRPDGEEDGQPTAEDIARSAAEAGLEAVHAPVRGLPDPAVVAATRDVLNGLGPDDRALFFCRSGMRSAAAWAMAERQNGVDAETLRDAAATAGYDLGRLPL